MFQTLEPSPGSAHVNVKNLSESTDWWEQKALWVRGDYICTLFSPLSTLLHPSHYLLSLPHSLIPSSLIQLSFLSLHLVFFPFLTSLSLLLCLQPRLLPPSALLQSLACCLVHATGRSLLTDGWTGEGQGYKTLGRMKQEGPCTLSGLKAVPYF